MKESVETLKYFDNIMKDCKKLFLKKNRDYGPSWLVLRWESLIDQIWIKTKRIRKLEQTSDKKLIPEGRDVEYIGIINYSIIGLIRLWYKDELPNPDEIVNKGKIIEIDEEKLSRFYDNIVNEVRNLLIKKNHDYGEAWRDMKITSITDQIFVRLFRCKKILENGKLEVSEGLEAQFSDIINYALFALIKLQIKEKKNETITVFDTFKSKPKENR